MPRYLAVLFSGRQERGTCTYLSQMFLRLSESECNFLLKNCYWKHRCLKFSFVPLSCLTQFCSLSSFSKNCIFCALKGLYDDDLELITYSFKKIVTSFKTKAKSNDPEMLIKKNIHAFFFKKQNACE